MSSSGIAKTIWICHLPLSCYQEYTAQPQRRHNGAFDICLCRSIQYKVLIESDTALSHTANVQETATPLTEFHNAASSSKRLRQTRDKLVTRCKCHIHCLRQRMPFYIDWDNTVSINAVLQAAL